MIELPKSARAKAGAWAVFLDSPGWAMLRGHMQQQVENRIANMIREDTDDSRRAALAGEVRAFRAALAWPADQLAKEEEKATKERRDA